MITPKFSLEQDNDFVYVSIYAPFINLVNAECHIVENEFYFYSLPYYLRLHLPGFLVDGDKTKSHFDTDKSILKVTIEKLNSGEHFSDLQMLTKLLTPSRKSRVENTEIEVTSQETPDSCEHTDEDFDWYIEQKFNTDEKDILGGYPYGFGNLKSVGIQNVLSELPQIVDLKNPEQTSMYKRKEFKTKDEQQAFNFEHYLADFFEDEEIKSAVKCEYPELTGIPGEKSELCKSELEILRQLPRKEYHLDKSTVNNVYLSLVDLLFSYSFDYRFRHGENNVESDWTICKLSSTLSWLDTFYNITDVVISCARRSLCFPLYRHWSMFERVLIDVKTILKCGKIQILKCLLDMHSIIKRSEDRYPLDELYIKDYCVWIQSADTEILESLSTALDKVSISKEDVGLRLKELEEDAKKLMELDEDKLTTEEALVQKITNVVRISANEDFDSDDCDE